MKSHVLLVELLCIRVVYISCIDKLSQEVVSCSGVGHKTKRRGYSVVHVVAGI
jgi:hypothetical protein